MCCPAQAIDQQPLKTAQFYVIPWKSEGVSAIGYAPQAFTAALSARLPPVGIHYIIFSGPCWRQIYTISLCFYWLFKIESVTPRETALPLTVGFPYVPVKNTGPESSPPI